MEGRPFKNPLIFEFFAKKQRQQKIYKKNNSYQPLSLTI